MMFGFGLCRKKNYNRMFQKDVELESKKHFEQNQRYQVSAHSEGNHTERRFKDGKADKMQRYNRYNMKS